ncbi:methyltransferase [Longimicrobium terrae]|nr:methyltransferase [Longimicrobium terrae]
MRQALLSPDSNSSRVLLANALGPRLIEYLQSANVLPLHSLAIAGQLRPGIPFTYQGHFYGKGFGASNRTPHVSLSENLVDVLSGKKLVVNFSKSGIITDTAYTRLSGSTNLFAFCSVTEISVSEVRAVPYLVGDLVERVSGLDLPFTDQLRLRVQDIDQFEGIDFRQPVSKAEFQRLKNVPERVVKELFCELLGEESVPKDWGGEEADLFSSNLSVNGRKSVAAFLLKGPSRFHEMTPADCGKNGDQIYRLFNSPAEVFVVQHCHKISPAVRKTVEAFALSKYADSCRYTFIDGYDTARILRAHGRL